MGDVLAKRWVAKVMAQLIALGGTTVSNDVFEKRKKACESCEFYGEVPAMVGVALMGCTICKCPVETKCRMKVLMRLVENHGKPLTKKEILFNSVFGVHLRPEVVRCSDFDNIDRWKGL